MALKVQEECRCIKCNGTMINIAEIGLQPIGGLAFVTHGHYGSTYFDPMDAQSYLEIALCDDCVRDAERTGIIHREEPPRKITSFLKKQRVRRKWERSA